MPSPFNPSNPVAIGGAGGMDVGQQSGVGTVAIQDPPRNRPFPWPYPESAFQGGANGGGATMGAVQVPIPPRPSISFPNGPYSNMQYSPNSAPVCMG